jgi:hypothetical protein
MDRSTPELLLAPYPDEIRATAEALCAVVRRAIPDAIERVRPGWGLIGYDVPVGRRTAYFAFVWPEWEHAHLGFEHGVLLADPDGRLQGAGVTKQVRWVTFTRPEQIDEAALVPFVRGAARVASLTRSERVALALDRD